MTVTDWIVAIVALCALVLSIYNTYAQRRDRTPRVEMTASWAVSGHAPGALQNLVDPTTEPGKADYRCEITNIGIAGVKIRKVTVVPQAAPGRPLPISVWGLPCEEKEKSFSPALLLALIHPTSWKMNSPKYRRRTANLWSCRSRP